MANVYASIGETDAIEGKGTMRKVINGKTYRRHTAHLLVMQHCPLLDNNTKKPAFTLAFGSYSIV